MNALEWRWGVDASGNVRWFAVGTTATNFYCTITAWVDMTDALFEAQCCGYCGA